ncbi:MAG: amino acid ABC transporter ATP-binding protein [Atopobiaceae bacterium]|nr:amino acid ABC transporter ATP-binding protein [Atopobiaceae bacterium]
MVEVTGLSKTFDGQTEVLRDVNFHVNKGETVAILGPSGTGKSTLLRCLNYLCVPTSGDIRIKDTTVTALGTRAQIKELRKHSAMVFQNYNLFKNLTALGNVTEALLVAKKMSKKEAEERALECLEKVGMLDRKDFYPSKMSGGQQQRVGIARAIALEPDVLLLDEPTSSLDPELVGEVLSTIRKLASENSTMILVTHEISFARQVSDRIVFMDGGTVAAQGSPEEIIDNPQNERIAKFLSYFKGEVKGVSETPAAGVAPTPSPDASE